MRVDGGVVRAIVLGEGLPMATVKANAVRRLDRLGVSYELSEYEVDSGIWTRFTSPVTPGNRQVTMASGLYHRRCRGREPSP